MGWWDLAARQADSVRERMPRNWLMDTYAKMKGAMGSKGVGKISGLIGKQVLGALGLGLPIGPGLLDNATPAQQVKRIAVLGAAGAAIAGGGMAAPAALAGGAKLVARARAALGNGGGRAGGIAGAAIKGVAQGAMTETRAAVRRALRPKKRKKLTGAAVVRAATRRRRTTKPARQRRRSSKPPSAKQLAARRKFAEMARARAAARRR